MGKGMKKLMPKKTICKLGLLTLGIYVILAVTPICFSGVTYNLINYNWATDGLWRHLGNLEIISCVLFFLLCYVSVIHCGVVGNIQAFHVCAPGSIPGDGIFDLFSLLLL